MTSPLPAPVTDALDAARRALADEVSRTAAEIVEIDQEIGNVGQAIDNLVERRDALVEFRARLAERSASLRAQTAQQEHEALYDTLEAQATALVERAQVMTTARPDRLALTTPLDAAIAALLDELAELRAASASAEAEAQVRRRLLALLRERSAPPALDTPALPIDVVTCIDAPDGQPELLVILVPVPPTAAERDTADDTLTTWFAARVGQAVFTAARATGFDDVDPRTGPALGRELLDVEVDLQDAPASFADEVSRHLAERLRSAPELHAARLDVRCTALDAQVVFPPDAEPDDG